MSEEASEKRVAIVTGGSRGIGLEIARELVRSLGMKVIAVDIVQQQIADLPDTFGEGAESVEGRVMDVTDTAGFTALIDEIAEKEGRVDVLVNNAGITRDGLLMRMSDEDWAAVINVNLTSAFIGTRAAAKHMVRQRGGSIVNVSSFAGVAGNPGQANYSASKAGMLGLTKTTAKELAGKNVRCNAVAPGFIRTDMTDVLPQKVKDTALAVIPLKRMGETCDVARAVRFLASDDSQYITGQVLCVDGGMHT
ncbi:MAG: 3-oxoacyl-[acyl-carrier-protein] reductase [Phycisphaerales bacterium]|nr:MAG: 3-oxoacyl-[acyl-carrier-protein] reductase [Phycisphaerales bacterium]